MSQLENIKVTSEWLQDEDLQSLFDLLTVDGGEARVAGGAVRNALMGIAASDIDLCTTLFPQEVVKRLERAGHKAVPTGIDHGTVTAVINGKPFEVTTLRKDIETDGRHAVVEFGMDWQEDANRRDLTMNGLYCDREGNVFDFVNGYADIKTQTVRFIGDAETRIKEDSLRILRFFRFFAWYGGGRPDAIGLKACASGRNLMAGLSVERVWSELKKMLAAPDPSRAILWMRTTGILGGVLPETHKWGTAMGKRMTFSNAETNQMIAWADNPAPKADVALKELDKLLYMNDTGGFISSMKLEVVHLRGREDEAGSDAMLKLIEHAQSWEKPQFPVQGKDLIAAGMEAGSEMGGRLKRLEEAWIESGFTLDKNALMML